MILVSPTRVSGQSEFPKPYLAALAEAAKPLSKLDDKNFSCESTLITSSFQQGKQVNYTAKYITKVSGNNAVYGNYVTYAKPKGSDTHAFNGLLSVNSRYFFKAERNKAADAWLLVEVLKNDDALDSNNPKGVEVLNIVKKPAFDGLFTIPLEIGKTAAGQIFEIPGFSLSSISESEDRRKITVIFRCPSKTDALSGPMSDCRVVYDLDQFGLPVEFSEVTKSDRIDRENTVKFTLQRTGESEFAFNIKSKLVYKTAGKVTYSDETEAKPVYTLGKLPESEFTASAFGLPEPPGYESSPTPIYVWILAIAVILFGLAILFRYLAKRKNLG